MRTQVFKWLFWAFFGNDDDGLYGDINWNPIQYKSRWIAIKWWLRNPFHNFTFYVIGLARVDKSKWKRYGRYPQNVFAPSDGWNWCVIKYGWLWLPFISYHEKLHGMFYIGWRERGNFGIKLTGDLLAIVSTILFIFIIINYYL